MWKRLRCEGNAFDDVLHFLKCMLFWDYGVPSILALSNETNEKMIQLYPENNITDKHPEIEGRAAMLDHHKILALAWSRTQLDVKLLKSYQPSERYDLFPELRFQKCILDQTWSLRGIALSNNSDLHESWWEYANHQNPCQNTMDQLNASEANAHSNTGLLPEFLHTFETASHGSCLRSCQDNKDCDYATVFGNIENKSIIGKLKCVLSDSPSIFSTYDRMQHTEVYFYKNGHI